MSDRNQIKIEEVVGAETEHAWIIAHYPSDADKAVATCPAEALFIVATKMGLEQVTLADCKRLLKVGRRAAIMDQKDVDNDVSA